MISVTRTEDIATCQALRRRVFIEEQGVDEALDLDGLDGDAMHLLARRDGVALGTARLMVQGTTGKIGRVCVLAQARGMGIGVLIMQAAEAEFRKLPEVTRLKLAAQTHALGFYMRLGYQAVGDEFLDAGFPHQDMVLLL